MEDKIEVNEYVRFNNGEIGKVIDIKENPAIEAMENQEQEIMIINVVSIGVSVIALMTIVNIYYYSRNKKI